VKLSNFSRTLQEDEFINWMNNIESFLIQGCPRVDKSEDSHYQIEGRIFYVVRVIEEDTRARRKTKNE
jgi:hypothetical protein